MIFVDTNVLMYAVGRAHPLRDQAREFLRAHVGRRTGLVTSTEVLQELLHAYVPVGRVPTLDSALTLVDGCFTDVWSVEAADVRLARLLIETHPELDARDLLHVACCRRREVAEVFTFDRALEAAFRAS